MDRQVLNPVLICLVIVFAIVFLYLQWGWHLHFGATFQEDYSSDLDDMSPAAVQREELQIGGVVVKTRTTSTDEEEEACSICLGVFMAGEKEKLLPRCGHSFHPRCIDKWFHSKLTCPLCRAHSAR